MIRAHLATFPPRRSILRRVTDAIGPQVDQLFVVLNGYDDVPGYLARDPKVTAVIPETDTRDTGKMHFAPAPDDIVFLIDDDLTYPADYIRKTIARAEIVGWDGRIMGYLGFSGRREGLRFAWKIHYLRAELSEPRDVVMLGTGAVVARGDMLAPFDAVAAFQGAVDVGLAQWAHDNNITMTILPREADWLQQNLPKRLDATSIHKTDSRNPPPHVSAVLHKLALIAQQQMAH